VYKQHQHSAKRRRRADFNPCRARGCQLHVRIEDRRAAMIAPSEAAKGTPIPPPEPLFRRTI
jgi:hypothetical protein